VLQASGSEVLVSSVPEGLSDSVPEVLSDSVPEVLADCPLTVTEVSWIRNTPLLRFGTLLYFKWEVLF